MSCITKFTFSGGNLLAMGTKRIIVRGKREKVETHQYPLHEIGHVQTPEPFPQPYRSSQFHTSIDSPYLPKASARAEIESSLSDALLICEDLLDWPKIIVPTHHVLHDIVK